ncbi:tetratricopeptide repeat protein [Alphaproteobacteria bacterium LSUCC0684]
MLIISAGAAATSGKSPDNTLAEHLILARRGSPEAMVEVAKLLLEDRRWRNDDTLHSDAFGWALIAARLGHPEAATLTGSLYRSGTGVKQNFVKSGKWLWRARQRQARGADFELALFYQDERNPVQDKAKASYHLKAALNKKDPRACVLAAQQKIQRQIPTRETLKELTCAAEGGIIPAMLILATYYEKKSSPNALFKAEAWLKKAVAAGSSTALERLYPLP